MTYAASPSVSIVRQGTLTESRWWWPIPLTCTFATSTNHDLVTLRVHRRLLTLTQAAVQDRGGQPVADLALDDPLQRSSAECRVEPRMGHQRGRGRRHLQVDPPGGQPLAQMAELNLDDSAQVVLGQCPEVHDVVDPIDELRLEEVLGVARQGRRHD